MRRIPTPRASSQNFLYTAEDPAAARRTRAARARVHPDVKEPAGRTPLTQIKLLPDDPAAMLPQVAEIKKQLHGALRQLTCSRAIGDGAMPRAGSDARRGPSTDRAVLDRHGAAARGARAAADVLACWSRASPDDAGHFTLEHYRQLVVDPAFVKPLLDHAVDVGRRGRAVRARGRADGLARRAHRPAGQAACCAC